MITYPWVSLLTRIPDIHPDWSQVLSEGLPRVGLIQIFVHEMTRSSVLRYRISHIKHTKARLLASRVSHEFRHLSVGLGLP